MSTARGQWTRPIPRLKRRFIPPQTVLRSNQDRGSPRCRIPLFFRLLVRRTQPTGTARRLDSRRRSVPVRSACTSGCDVPYDSLVRCDRLEQRFQFLDFWHRLSLLVSRICVLGSLPQPLRGFRQSQPLALPLAAQQECQQHADPVGPDLEGLSTSRLAAMTASSRIRIAPVPSAVRGNAASGARWHPTLAPHRRVRSPEGIDSHRGESPGDSLPSEPSA